MKISWIYTATDIPSGEESYNSLQGTITLLLNIGFLKLLGIWIGAQTSSLKRKGNVDNVYTYKILDL